MLLLLGLGDRGLVGFLDLFEQLLGLVVELAVDAPGDDAEVDVLVAAEVRVDDGLVLHDGLGRTLGDDAALGHDDDPVGDVAHHVHVVLDEQHGHAEVLEVEDVVEQRLGERRVDAGHRLVEHDQRRVAHERARHLEELALTARERRGEVVGLGVELEAREQLHAPCLRSRCPACARSPG